jgi:hypothetical protein
VKARVLPRLAAALFGSAVAFSVLEIGLRLMPQAISPRLLILFEPDLRAQIAGGSFMVRSDFVELERDDQGPPLYVRKPQTRIVSVDERGPDSQQRTDELGFCNPAGSYQKQDVIALVAIGDSFTWCHDVKTTQGWVYRLGERAGLASYNLGRGGSGPYEYLQVLKRFGLAKRPRIVVFNLYAGNDLRDADYYWEYRQEFERTGRPPSEEPTPVLPEIINGPIGRHSYALNFTLAFATRVWEHHVTDRERSGIDFRYTLELGAESVPFNVESRDEDEVVYARRMNEARVSLALWDNALRALGELAREHGFAAVVTYTPSAHTTYGVRVRFSDPELAPVLETLNQAQRAFLAERAGELGYAFHDLTPALREAASEDDGGALLYDPLTIHLTPRGHEVIAESLAQFLSERHLTPAS